jgi:hypothetical protein
MNIILYHCPINWPVNLESIEKSITELTYMYLRRSYNPNKREEITTFSTRHEHYSSLEFPTKVKMSNYSLRGFRENIEVVHHSELRT